VEINITGILCTSNFKTETCQQEFFQQLTAELHHSPTATGNTLLEKYLVKWKILLSQQKFCAFMSGIMQMASEKALGKSSSEDECRANVTSSV